MKRIIAGLFFLVFSVQAEEFGGLNAERKVTVKYGDTLWSISALEYGDGNLWERIYEANRISVKNPELIFPGDELFIPGKYEILKPVLKDAPANSGLSEVAVSSSAVAEKEILPAKKPDEEKKEVTEPNSEKPQAQRLKEPEINEEIPENLVFSNITNKTISAPKKYFDGKVKGLNKEDELEKNGLAQKGDELLLKTSLEDARIGDVFEIYSQMFEKSGKITAQLCGRCETVYVEGLRLTCKLFWVNGYLEEGMLIKRK